MFQSAGRDDVIDTTLLEGLADDVRPLDEIVGKLVILAAVVAHDVQHDSLLDCLRWVVLLVHDIEPLKEGFVEDVRACEPLAALACLPLRVGGGEHVETGGGGDILVDLLEEDALALKHGLKAHDLVRAEVNLVKQQNRATLHGGDDCAILPYRVAVDQAEATEQVILVGLRRDVDADVLAVQLGADLLHHRRLAVARQTRDVDGVEPPRLDDLADVCEMPVGDIVRQLRGDQVVGGGGADGRLIVQD